MAVSAAPIAPNYGRVLVLQHHPDEHPDTLEPLLEDAGLSLTTVELDAAERIPDLAPFDLMVAMGGPQQVWQEDQHPWLVEEKAAIGHWVSDLDRPFVGVCLGHQLLAAALGGTVGEMESTEIGVHEIELTVQARHDPLFGHLPSTLTGLQWHVAEVVELPPDTTVLATNEQSAIQAMRVGRKAYGVQFHVEVGVNTIPKWAAIPEYERELADHFGSAETLRLQVEEHLDALTVTAASLVHGLLNRVVGVRATANRPLHQRGNTTEVNIRVPAPVQPEPAVS